MERDDESSFHSVDGVVTSKTKHATMNQNRRIDRNRSFLLINLQREPLPKIKGPDWNQDVWNLEPGDDTHTSVITIENGH